MSTKKENSKLYTLWLPITDFDALRQNLKKSKKVDLVSDNANLFWSWIVLKYQSMTIIMDSLGFIYLDKVESHSMKEEVLKLLEELLNEETKANILDTFLNVEIGFKEVSLSEGLLDFLQEIVMEFNPIEENIKLEYIYANLFVDLEKQEHLEESEATLAHKYKISSLKKMKFSFKEEEDSSKSFHSILNRNFKNLLEKSILYTHGLFFDKGEFYNLSIINHDFNKGSDFIHFELFINEKDNSEHRAKLFNQIFKKAIQDTIEERTILHFLKITRRKYLRQIINEIGVKNELLKQLNSYLLDDLEQSMESREHETRGSDDELVVEIFIQNLLQAIPKFQMMDARLKEAYYVKIGNTTTNLQVGKDETIVSTLDYGKWKSLVNFFIDTASKVNESLTMYHQNKTLKELEDISYNANYQADIEDIRELQKNKTVLLDEDSKRIFLFIAVVALAAEAPLLESNLALPNLIPFEEIKRLISIDKLSDKFATNLIDVIVNSMLYMFFIFGIAKPLFLDKNEPIDNKKVKTSQLKKIWNRLKECCHKVTKPKIYYFEESDYDKHEHRSSKVLLSYNKENNDFEKQTISYNNAISSYDLVKKLKKILLKQKVHDEVLSYSLFPKLLKETPIESKDRYIYRENYRISGNNRVATKIMYRYKLNNLSLEDFLAYMKEDLFMQGYALYLKEQNFSVEEQYKILEPLEKESLFLTLYIVYSFVLKIHEIKDGKEYTYTIAKDQFRVHYHINKLEYKDRENFEAKQDALAKLIDIYFLGRLKRIEK